MLMDQFYYNKQMLKDWNNLGVYIDPLKTSFHKMFGMLEYLKGIEWNLVDDFKRTHAQIAAGTLLLWGANDKTFPLRLAKKMVDQFRGNCRLEAIPLAALMVHKEKPAEVLAKIIPFLQSNDQDIPR